MTTDQAFAKRLNELLASAGIPELDGELCEKFQAYLALLVRWNTRMNLTAIRSEDAILSRHFVESIQCARFLPTGVKTLLDFGSGGGFPGVPIALCRGEIEVTLAESQNKKAAFLQEVVRTLGLRSTVYAGRAEKVGKNFDVVVLRAVDRMEDAVGVAQGLVSPGGYLILMTTVGDLSALQPAAGAAFVWRRTESLVSSEDRVVALARKAAVRGGAMRA